MTYSVIIGLILCNRAKCICIYNALFFKYYLTLLSVIPILFFHRNILENLFHFLKIWHYIAKHIFASLWSIMIHFKISIPYSLLWVNKWTAISFRIQNGLLDWYMTSILWPQANFLFLVKVKIFSKFEFLFCRKLIGFQHS